MNAELRRYRYIQRKGKIALVTATPFLQSALLIKHVWQSGDAIQTSSLLACRCQCDIVEQVQLRLGVLAGLEVEQQIILDSKYGIVGHPWVVTGVQLCNKRLVSFG
jgi:hypothetical protein